MANIALLGETKKKKSEGHNCHWNRALPYGSTNDPGKNKREGEGGQVGLFLFSLLRLKAKAVLVGLANHKKKTSSILDGVRGLP